MTPTDSADLEMIETVVDAIDDRAIGEEGGEALPARLEHIVGAADVEIALVLAGEAGRRQVLGGGRTANGDRDIGAVLGLELAVGGGDRLTHRLAPGRRIDDPPRLGAARGEKLDVGDVEIVQQRVQRLPDLRGLHGAVIDVDREREAVGHAHALGGHFAKHFAERRVFATHRGHVFQANGLEPTDGIGEITHRGLLVQSESEAFCVRLTLICVSLAPRSAFPSLGRAPKQPP